MKTSNHVLTAEQQELITAVDDEISRLELVLVKNAKCAIATMQKRVESGKSVKAVTKDLNRYLAELKDLSFNINEQAAIFLRKKKNALALVAAHRKSGEPLDQVKHHLALDFLESSDLEGITLI